MTDDNSTAAVCPPPPLPAPSWDLAPADARQTTTNRANSDDEFYDVDEESDSQGISRTRLRIDEARSRFLPSDADAKRAGFSDRVDGKRKTYKTSSHRQRLLEDGTYEFGDLSDDEDDEDLERRIARLQREIEEAKAEYGKRNTATEARPEDKPPSDIRLDTLSQVLDEIAKPLGVEFARSSQRAAPLPTTTPGVSEDSPSRDDATYTVTYAPAYEQSHALAKAADFDRRLSILEKALGTNGSSFTENGANGLPRAILPTLESLDKQITTLSQASTANLDAISRRVRTLASEQDKLNDAREKAKTLREELGKQAPSATDESEQESKITALYGILPTIENLTPILPPLLDRLRSLRAIHADAATASQTLERIEKQQTEMTGELKQWRDGLEKMERTVAESDASMKENVQVMEGWVKDLEQRMTKLS